MAQVVLQQASVQIPIYNARSRSIKNMITRQAVGATIGRRPDRDLVVVTALNSISLSLNPGDRVGLIGQNGAGKTTLLRVISGVYVPTSGTAAVNGNVAALTDFAMGIDPEASGRENIFIRAILLGMTYQQARALAPEVEDFSELGDYLDLPVRTYSTGMMLRLAFAITTSVEPEILVMDEMIAAGDASFKKKATDRINELINKASIFVVATHSEDILKQLCNRALWMHNGQVIADGAVDEILSAYNEFNGSTNKASLAHA
jgi:ABC-type polysaccharide/polyol phosphate transport system ATPase subunit